VCNEKENKQLRMERELLKEAAASFAKKSDEDINISRWELSSVIFSARAKFNHLQSRKKKLHQ